MDKHPVGLALSNHRLEAQVGRVVGGILGFEGSLGHKDGIRKALYLILFSYQPSHSFASHDLGCLG